jgi:hypothetical protein
VINPALVSGLRFPVGLSLFDDHLFVVNYGATAPGDLFQGYVGEYNLDGTPVNPKLITGLTTPIDIVVGRVPEPSSLPCVALATLSATLGSTGRRRRGDAPTTPPSRPSAARERPAS